MKKHILATAIAVSTVFSAASAMANSSWVAQGVTLNARSGPGTNYHVMYKLPACAQVQVMGWQHGWAKVSYQHNQYWVSGKYLQTHACQQYHNNTHNTQNNTYNTQKKDY